MIKNYIDYLRAFFRNWKEIKENINRIIVQDLIHRKVVLHTDDLDETFAKMKYIVDYKPTYKQKQLPLPNSGELIDITKIFNLSEQASEEFLKTETPKHYERK